MVTKTAKTALAASLLFALMIVVAKPARAGGVGADTVGLFPKETAEFGYVDLKKARTMKWFPALEQQLLPERFRQFQKFLASAGVDPNTQVDELVWGLVPDSTTNAQGVATSLPSGERTIGIAMGNYNPESTEAFFKQQKLPMLKVDNYTLFAFGSGTAADDLFFFFLDSSKAVFGHKALLDKLLEIRVGRADGLLRNDAMYNLINEANGSGVVWAVLDAGYTQLAMSQLAPEVQQFPDAAKLIQKMRSMVISANASSGVDAKFQAVCGSTQDANTLGQLVQAGLLYKKYQASKDNPEFGQLLDQTNVVPSGDRLVIGMTVSDDQMAALIRRNTFAFNYSH